MANARHCTLYTGVTSNLIQRVFQHKEEFFPGFTKKYNCKILVWFELHSTITNAIQREKQIKGGSRKRKIELIEQMNPGWIDLYSGLL